MTMFRHDRNPLPTWYIWARGLWWKGLDAEFDGSGSLHITSTYFHAPADIIWSGTTQNGA